MILHRAVVNAKRQAAAVLDANTALTDVEVVQAERCDIGDAQADGLLVVAADREVAERTADV
jgi:hypothetical protein